MIRIIFSILGKIKRIIRRLLGLGNVSIGVEHYWSDERHTAVQGWLSSDGGKIEAVEMKNGDTWIPVEQLRDIPPNPDAPARPNSDAKNYTIQVAHKKPMDLSFRVKTKGRWSKCDVRQSPPDCAENLDVPNSDGLFDQFIKEVNEKNLKVLEIGSRIVSPGSVSKRPLFPGASSFVGFDYYPDDNTDIAGDAHRLSEYVKEGEFDAVFSIAVFEHLAMPWIVAREINKVLKVGGITYHGTVFSWPTHERPWDFWRLSDEGLKVLFSPVLGYEVIGAGMFDRVSMHFRELRAGHEGFPHADAYASSSILARKTGSFDDDKFQWPSDITSFVGTDSHYPEAKKTDTYVS